MSGLWSQTLEIYLGEDRGEVLIKGPSSFITWDPLWVDPFIYPHKFTMSHANHIAKLEGSTNGAEIFPYYLANLLLASHTVNRIEKRTIESVN